MLKNNGRYILDSDGTPVPCEDLITWGTWMSTPEVRKVALDQLTINGEAVKVSTVFLGLDHNYYGQGEPILYETMIFGGYHSDDMYRYCTKDEALIGHANALKLVKGEMK